MLTNDKTCSLQGNRFKINKRNRFFVYIVRQHNFWCPSLIIVLPNDKSNCLLIYQVVEREQGAFLAQTLNLSDKYFYLYDEHF